MSSGRTSYSLRRRLLAWLFAPLLAIGALALADTYDEAVDTADAVSDRVLAGSALAIAERVVIGDGGALEVDIPYVALEMLTSAAQDRVFYRIDGPPGTFMTGYEELPTLDVLEQNVPAFAGSTFRGEPIRIAALARSASTGTSSVPFIVTVAETTIARSHLAQTILLRSTLRIGLIIAAAAIVMWLAVTASLRPLEQLRLAIAERSPDDLSPINSPVPTEVGSLVGTVNSFMARLGGALSAMRHFTGNAGHQLRTPMSIMRTQLALASRATSIEQAREAARIGDGAVEHAERVLAQLLLLARIDAAASEKLASAGRFDLMALARDETAEAVPRAAEADIDLGFEADGAVEIDAEPLLVGEMLRNLIGNVVAYAGNGTAATVRVYIAAGAVLEVEDNGPGLDPTRLAAVRKRFVRGDSAVPGAGLGLPIVEEIAALFGGTLELAQGPDGRGLLARVRFPPATRAAAETMGRG